MSKPFFSTLVGTWRNGLGQEFTFDKNGLVNSGNIEKVAWVAMERLNSALEMVSQAME